MWLLDDTRIFVQKFEGNISQIIPRLQPLAGGTVLQFFGYESEITNVAFKIVGSGDLSTLKGMAIDYSYHTLSGPNNFVQDFYVKGMNHSMDRAVAQTIRPDLDCYDPVYNVELELYE